VIGGKDILFLKEVPDGVLLNLRVIPRSFRTGFAGLYGETSVKLRIQSPPVENAANRACQKFLAKKLGVSKAQLIIKSGLKSRDKVVLIRNVSLEYVRNRLDV